MYYWLRGDNVLTTLPWLSVMLLWWAGGYLLVRQLFNLEKHERLLVGFGVGTITYIWLVNLLGHWIGPKVVFILAAFLVLASGILITWRLGKRTWANREDIECWPWLVVGLVLIAIFARFGQGLGIFDEPKNLSLISIIGAGDIPPGFYPDFPINHKYHYGFHILGGSLMQLGGLYPWSAFDLSKAIFWAYTVLLAALLGKRYIPLRWGAFSTAFVLVFASGTRYLLLFLPKAFFIRADKLVQLQGTSGLMGVPFSEALLQGWPLDGGPVSPYMFAFLNGIMDPFILSHQGPNAFSLTIFFLLWLVIGRLDWKYTAGLLALVFSTWALAWETSYALFVIGVFGFAVIAWLKKTRDFAPAYLQTFWAVVISIPVVLLQGGTLSEMLRSFIMGKIYTLDQLIDWYHGSGTFIMAFLDGGILEKLNIPFMIRWPPAILSSHLGELSLLSPITLVIALLELGPVILFIYWITRWAICKTREGDWIMGVLSISAWFGFLIPIVLKYESDRDISRITWQALLIWTIMLVFMVWDEKAQWNQWVRKAAVFGLVFMCFGGLVILSSQMTALRSTNLGYAMNELDAQIASEVWGDIPTNAKVYGPLGRTTILTGHLTGALLEEPPFWVVDEWYQIEKTPDIHKIAELGYDYVYLTSRWYQELPEEYQQTFNEACIKTLAASSDNSGDNFRKFLDIQECYP
ncbi:MAG: hypothetical protein JXA19_01875 [Anaerolineales bacterium]|nr:hypothetical protein [Anaerolineales bacterium]